MRRTQEITAAIESKNTIGVFIDLQKAFDIIDCTILNSRLKSYGVGRVALNWFGNYLDNRQYVQFSGNRSEYMNIDVESHKALFWGLNFLICT